MQSSGKSRISSNGEEGQVHVRKTSELHPGPAACPLSVSRHLLVIGSEAINLA
jgi:hypothetical protein